MSGSRWWYVCVVEGAGKRTRVPGNLKSAIAAAAKAARVAEFKNAKVDLVHKWVTVASAWPGEDWTVVHERIPADCRP